MSTRFYYGQQDYIIQLNEMDDIATASATSAAGFAKQALDAAAAAQAAAETATNGQVNADWNATTGKAQILNKPTLAAVATSGSKADVGLGNVDNTADLAKPISTATQTALNAKQATITTGTTSQYYRGDKTWQTLNKAAVGLSNVDNTTDLLKPISTATQSALDAKASLASPTFTGTVTAVTFSGALAGNAATATKLAAAVNINGVPFDGSQDISISVGSNGEPPIAAGTTSQYWRGDKTWQTLNKAAVGLSAAENKSSSTIRGELTSANVTTALGFTPYNATNPSSYITSAGYAQGLNIFDTNQIIAAQGFAGGLLWFNYRGATAAITQVNIGNGMANSGLAAVVASNIDASGNVTGKAATATKLATARTINGVSFDGTTDITVADSTKTPLNGTGATGTWPIAISGKATTAGAADSAAKLTGNAYTNGSDGWFRSAGNAGWYNSTYGVGIMSDTVGLIKITSGGPELRSLMALDITTTGSYFGNGAGLTGTAASLTAGKVGWFKQLNTGANDLNTVDYQYSGIYRFDAPQYNSPGFAYGNMLTVNGGGDTFAQIAFDYAGPNIKWRSGIVNSTGNNSAWRTLLSLENIGGYGIGWTGEQNFYSSTNQNVTAFGQWGPIGRLICNSGGVAPAIMSFHRPGYQAVNIGLDNDGYFKIGGWSYGTACYVNLGNGDFVANGNVIAYSDGRLKRDWKDVPEDFVYRWAKVRAGSYYRTDKENPTEDIGLLAQDVQRIIPQATPLQGNGYLGLAYGPAAAVATVKLAQKVVELETVIGRLLERIEKLEEA